MECVRMELLLKLIGMAFAPTQACGAGELAFRSRFW